MALFSHPVYLRNGDVEHAYRADSDIAYLTGFEEPECALLLVPDGEGGGKTIGFVRPRDKEREIWDGRRHGPDGAREVFGLDDAFPVAELPTELPKLLRGTTALWSLFGRRNDDDERLFGAVATARQRSRRKGQWPVAYCDLAPALHGMRQRKDEDEIARLRAAVKASTAGHRRAMAVVRPGMNEADLEAVLTFAFRRGGAARHGYTPIVAGGENACILHYIENDAPLKDGDLVLIDAGAEHGLYTADITRTFPVSGTFTPPQQRLYELVLAAEQAAIASVKPGSNLVEVDAVARRTLAKGLQELGLLEGDLDTLVTKVPYEGMPEAHPGRAPLDRFYMHSTSHWLGSDVHDVGTYHDGEDPTPLVPGMVLTVEPGIYVSPTDADAPEEYRGIGIRIEDDVLVTEAGNEVLTRDVPRSVEDICALIGTETLPGTETP